MEIQDIITRLEEGNQRFTTDTLENNLVNQDRRTELTNGQAPHTIVLSCADSRVVPERAFDTGLGELFVLRVAGNIANTSTIASIEYAVAHCGSKVIVVMGHQACGAVTAAIAGGDNGKNLNHLLAHIKPAIEASNSTDVTTVVKKNAELTAIELATKSEIIGNAVANGSVKIVPAYYNLDTGKVDML